LAALSIVLVLASTLGGWHAPDDSDGYLQPSAHQHSDHNARLGPPAHAAPEHCVVCHFLRALGNGAPVATPLFAAELVPYSGAGELDDVLVTAFRLDLSSRAPPLP
jgi:hypothetical protein